MNQPTQRSLTPQYLLTSLFFIIILLLIPNICKSSDVSIKWSLFVLLFAAGVLVFQLVSLKWFSPQRRFVFPLFIILSYLFNISQVGLYGVGYELSDTVGWSSVFKSDDVQDATMVALESIVSLFWGGITYLVFFDKRKQFKHKETTGNAFVKVALLLGFIADFFVSIYMPITVGYSNLESSLLLNILRLFSLLFSSAIALMITDDSLSVKKRKKILIFFVCFKLVCMLSGYRAFSLINIVLAIYLYHKTTNTIRFTFKTVLLLIAGAILGSALLVAVRETRQTGVDLSVMAGMGVANNPILDLLAEFGITLNVLIVDLRELAGRGMDGGQLYTSLLSIVPGASSLFPGVDFDGLTMDTALDLRGIGGSYVGDLLFDFGIKGIIWSSFVLGIFISWMFETFETAIENKRYALLAFLFPLTVDVVFCVRSSLAKMPREIVWYFFIFMALKIVLSKAPQKTSF